MGGIHSKNKRTIDITTGTGMNPRKHPAPSISAPVSPSAGSITHTAENRGPMNASLTDFYGENGAQRSRNVRTNPISSECRGFPGGRGTRRGPEARQWAQSPSTYLWTKGRRSSGTHQWRRGRRRPGTHQWTRGRGRRSPRATTLEPRNTRKTTAACMAGEKGRLNLAGDRKRPSTLTIGKKATQEQTQPSRELCSERQRWALKQNSHKNDDFFGVQPIEQGLPSKPRQNRKRSFSFAGSESGLLAPSYVRNRFVSASFFIWGITCFIIGLVEYGDHLDDPGGRVDIFFIAYGALAMSSPLLCLLHGNSFEEGIGWPFGMLVSLVAGAIGAGISVDHASELPPALHFVTVVNALLVAFHFFRLVCRCWCNTVFTQSGISTTGGVRQNTSHHRAGHPGPITCPEGYGPGICPGGGGDGGECGGGGGGGECGGGGGGCDGGGGGC